MPHCARGPESPTASQSCVGTLSGWPAPLAADAPTELLSRCAASAAATAGASAATAGSSAVGAELPVPAATTPAAPRAATTAASASQPGSTAPGAAQPAADVLGALTPLERWEGKRTCSWPYRVGVWRSVTLQPGRQAGSGGCEQPVLPQCPVTWEKVELLEHPHHAGSPLALLPVC